MKSTSLIFTLGLSTIISATAGDWTQFRGPNTSGISDETNLPISLDADKNIAWKSELPGRGLSAPVVVGDRIFLTASSGPKQDRLHILCINAADGVQLWERKFWATGRTMSHNKTCNAAPTPATDGKHLVAFYSSNDLICVDLDGNLMWLRGLTHDYPNASNSLGMSSSPIIIDDTVIVQVENDAESFAAGINLKDGSNRWKKDRPKSANWTSPLVFDDPNLGARVAVLQSSKGALCVEPKTGNEIWNYTDGASTIPSGTVANSKVYLVSNGITAIEPEATSNKPKQLWQSKRLRPATASPIVLGEFIYAVNNAGVLTCGNVNNGERVWQLRMKGPFSASPVSSGQYLYFVSEEGVAQVVDTLAPEGEVISEMALEETILGTPAVANSALYVRGDNHLWKIAKPLVL
jgi:outer membrane protein assembly factor BamB